MKAYKLTDQNGKTHINTQWGENVTHEVFANGEGLCSSSWLHFYTDPLIAILLNPAHENIQNPILWECEAEGEILHEPLKSDCKKLTTLRKIPTPEINSAQKIAFAILCAKEIYKDKVWSIWANNWLSGKDRNITYAAFAASVASVDSAASASAAFAAAASATSATSATYAAAFAAFAAIAAFAATYAAAYADINYKIDFSSIAKKAMEIQ